MVACRSHKPEVVGSSPTPAIPALLEKSLSRGKVTRPIPGWAIPARGRKITAFPSQIDRRSFFRLPFSL